ncbi:hypothetical protein [Yimella sp. cx-51]|uniref:hypothetical protein n=1 Tax=Yimella sp. cx-51 TaxID=2770551 RepID=UPI00165E970A|nr:hypothetical protein [Yimella sp. cx-51]MBC9955479.1 hypothetical protein [Yimella sp. cx-51]QTH37935.1 hypothetical protein J5M86_14015 [Yimella sp. cx-51]
MEFPRYWFLATRQLPRDITPARVAAWGWSNSSPFEAEAVANQRVDGVQSRALAGTLQRSGQKWYYPRTPLRECVIELISDTSGQAALLTRNMTGVVVLNTETLFIADIDVPEWAGGTAPAKRSFFGRLRGKPEPPPHSDEDDRRHPALATVRELVAGRTSVGARIYRTHSGFRVVVTGLRGADGWPLRAGTDESRNLLQQLGSDPLYVELSTAYRSYRARLTPKPHRCGMEHPPRPSVTPGTAVENSTFTVDPHWMSTYDQAASGFATCRLIETLGALPSPQEEQAIEVHDRLSRVGTDLPLA